jgi:uncharacterized membrane protein YjjP (DUF1212 family)
VSARTFVIQLGRAMHALSTPSYRVEDAMDACARRFGMHGSFFCTPTAIFAALAAPGEKPETTLERVEPGRDDLCKLAELYGVRDQVVTGEIAAEAGIDRIAAIMSAPPTNGDVLPILAQALGSAAACTFLGGGLPEIAVASAVGLLVGVLLFCTRRHPAFDRVYEPLACAFAAFAVHAAAAVVTPINTSVATIAAVIVLLPGLTLTTALSELSMRHLASGSARLMGAGATMLTMAVGVAIGSRCGVLAFGETAFVSPAELPPWMQLPAVAGAALGFAVLLRAAARQVPVVVLGVALAWTASSLGAASHDAEVAELVGAVCVTAAGNLYARLRRRPAAVVRTPGLLLLVPGSLGLRGITKVLQQQDFNGGIEFAFKMLLMGGSLVAGMLIAGLLVPPPLDVEPDSRLQAARGYAPRPPKSA